ncbi:ankyrin repeat domain protein [Tritrichomonas foetus]|uniref:Ankyrin repeat domain protein n=1 Tax=Tritrichomonas foetus TaxID=1144522 RepID=A0A1J4JMP2_9EUKA|nr:ankyrin repeat domain protein [Tritrichomonas foetus]|eukprot:OHS98803.1 ankyrin repeat domain protein [Tritrichomonas foetus]
MGEEEEESHYFERPQEFEMLLNLQEVVFSVNISNFSQKANDLKNLNCFIKPRAVHTTIVNIFNAIKYRPIHHFAYAQLLKVLLDMEDDTKCYSLIKPYTLSLFRAIVDDERSYPREAAIVAFIYDAFLLNCFTIAEVVETFKLVFKAHLNPTELAIVFFFYFCPELKSFNSDFFEYLLTSITNSEERTMPQEIHDIFDLMNDLFDNNFKMLRGWRECHAPPNSYADAILKDDCNMLQNIIAKEKATPNEYITPTIFGLSSFVVDKPTLIQYSCYFGSLKCFKYLILNDASLSYTDEKHRSLIQFAVAGGNSEIIHILEQKPILFSRTLAISIEYHHDQLFKWIYEHHYQGKLKEDAISINIYQIAMSSNNVQALEFIMRNKIKVKTDLFNSWENCWMTLLNGFIITYQTVYPNHTINLNYTAYDNHYTPLHWAVINKYDGIIETILSIRNYNINSLDDYGRTPFYLAVENGYVEILPVLKKYGAKINKRAKCNLTPIHAAIRNNQSGSIRFLLSVTDYDLNMKDSV